MTRWPAAQRGLGRGCHESRGPGWGVPRIASRRVESFGGDWRSTRPRAGPHGRAGRRQGGKSSALGPASLAVAGRPGDRVARPLEEESLDVPLGIERCESPLSGPYPASALARDRRNQQEAEACAVRVSCDCLQYRALCYCGDAPLVWSGAKTRVILERKFTKSAFQRSLIRLSSLHPRERHPGKRGAIAHRIPPARPSPATSGGSGSSLSLRGEPREVREVRTRRTARERARAPRAQRNRSPARHRHSPPDLNGVVTDALAEGRQATVHVSGDLTLGARAISSSRNSPPWIATES